MSRSLDPFLAVAATGMVLSATMATAEWRARNDSEVFPLSSGAFEVVNRARSAAQDYWCAAGDYAIRHLGTAATQRVYVWVPVGPSNSKPGHKGVQFSLSEPPGGPAPHSYSLSVKIAGENLTASAAQQYCYGQSIVDF